MSIEHIHGHSPLQIFNDPAQGQLEAGQLGVVTASAGVGKTAFLVQLGLTHLLQGHKVAHIALDGHTVARVQSWYDTLFDDLINLTEGIGTELKLEASRNTVIQVYNNESVSPDRIEKALSLYAEHMSFAPDILIVDGLDWNETDPVELAAHIGALKASAKRMGAELWLSARISRSAAKTTHIQGIPVPVDHFASLIDVAMSLEPHHDFVSLRLLRNRSNEPCDAVATLQSDTMRLLTSGTERSTVSLPAGVCTLLSGGAKGAEEGFGQCAEAWHLTEHNFTFKGRPMARSRGTVVLDDDQLMMGHVTDHYLREVMNRSYPDTPLFKKVLQTIWHQVNTAGQVFVVGLLLDDGTVKGGTGWAAELARHFNKELYVFDQEKRAWFTWENDAWKACEDDPRITSRRFTGTGSRELADSGKAAIEALFTDSFGPKPQA